MRQQIFVAAAMCGALGLTVTACGSPSSGRPKAPGGTGGSDETGGSSGSSGTARASTGSRRR